MNDFNERSENLEKFLEDFIQESVEFNKYLYDPNRQPSPLTRARLSLPNFGIVYNPMISRGDSYFIINPRTENAIARVSRRVSRVGPTIYIGYRGVSDYAPVFESFKDREEPRVVVYKANLAKLRKYV